MVPGPERDREISGLGLPIILVVLSLFVLMAFETAEAIHDRGALAEDRCRPDEAAGGHPQPAKAVGRGCRAVSLVLSCFGRSRSPFRPV